MEVKLQDDKKYLQNKLITTARAGRVCHNSDSDSENKISKKDYNLLKNLVKRGHHSVLEHFTMTFKVTGVSRALMQQQARHRISSLSVKSTRYTIKESIKEVEKILEEKVLLPIDFVEKYFYLEGIKNSRLKTKTYFQINKIYKDLLNCDWEKIPNDELKYIFPESLKTEFFLTINLRSLFNYYKLRSSDKALEEIRKLANKIYKASPQLIRRLIDEFKKLK